MNQIQFSVQGRPIPKARPRVTSRGHAYTPASTRDWEELIAWKAKEAFGDEEPSKERLAMVIDFYGARPNADLDNLAKCVLDGLNGVMYADDAQIDRLTLRRWLKDEDRPFPEGISVIVGSL